jgi:hypothetical protein
MFTAFRAHTLIITPPFPHAPQDPQSEHSASLRGTCAFSLLLKLETEVTLGLLIKLVGGETDAGEPRPAWVDEGAHVGDHT